MLHERNWCDLWFYMLRSINIKGKNRQLLLPEHFQVVFLLVLQLDGVCFDSYQQHRKKKLESSH